ncbi:hypothetical protein Q9L58_004330 [Maublancomyces gigas]|uniref:YCII-related domain-containing protein n=1 Tax=Discina gigas TaxID=1032678 RepID=A0ABR3GLC9_9PEZI
MPYQLDAAERRLKCRQEHLDGFKPLVAAKIFNLGGPYFDETPAEGAEIDFRGSVMSCVSESREAVIAVLKKDPYTLNEVWDWEKAQIFPFKCLVRTALE